MKTQNAAPNPIVGVNFFDLSPEAIVRLLMADARDVKIGMGPGEPCQTYVDGRNGLPPRLREASSGFGSDSSRPRR